MCQVLSGSCDRRAVAVNKIKYDVAGLAAVDDLIVFQLEFVAGSIDAFRNDSYAVISKNEFGPAARSYAVLDG